MFLKTVKLRRFLGAVAMPAALALGLGGGVQTAKAGAFLWIAAPRWTYSAAYAATTTNFAYFWAFSTGVGSYSWAAAWASNGFGSAAAFAQARAGFGGMGAARYVGFADPFAGVGIDTSLPDLSQAGSYPQSESNSDPFSSNYSISDLGITFNSPDSSSQLEGVDGLQAFVYTGATDGSQFENELCGSCTAPSSNPGNSGTGDLTNISDLTFTLGSTMIPLDNLVTDPSSLGSLNFTENTGMIAGDFSNVILVGEGETVPEPASMGLFGSGLIGLALALRRRRRT